MTDEELYIKWRNENSRIDRHSASPTRIGHKHIHWNNGVDRRKAFLDGLAEGRKESLEQIKLIESVADTNADESSELKKENEELKAQNKDLCESLDIMNNRESELLDDIKELKMHCKAVDEVNAKMKCCQMCTHLENNGSCLKANHKEVKEWGNFLIETRRTHYCQNWELADD